MGNEQKKQKEQAEIEFMKVSRENSSIFMSRESKIPRAKTPDSQKEGKEVINE